MEAALVAFLVGTALGGATTYAYFNAWRIWMRDEAKKWEATVLEEVKVLRAWKAAHIGQEPSPLQLVEQVGVPLHKEAAFTQTL